MIDRDGLRSILPHALLEGAEVYLHGSALTSLAPKDLDIVIIYGAEVSLRDLRTIKLSICEKSLQVFNVASDIISMSRNEAYIEGFISQFPLLVRVA